MEYLAYKFRVYPTKDQEQKLAQFFGAKRWIFNHYLAENKRRYKDKEHHLNHYDINKEITLLKKEEETSWLATIDDWCLKHAAEDLHLAYQNFFNSITGKRRGPKLESPKFKARSNQQSYRTRGISIKNGKLKLPKFKSLFRVAFDNRNFDQDKMKSATISKTPSGKYFVSILVEEESKVLPMTKQEVGIDLGLKDLCVLSNGVKFVHPETMLSKAKTALKKAQHKLAKKQKGSKNREKQRVKVARCYEKLTNIKNWYYHNISRYLVNNFDAIYMENLNVKGMLQNRKLSRKIHETAWSLLVNMINYKATSSGRTFHRIGRFVPSSKTCSCCGYKLDSLSLGTREWQCPSCNTSHDRDFNAAVNIKNFGQLDCYDQIIPSVDMPEVVSEVMPMSLQKYANKIERSSNFLVSIGSRKTQQSLVVE